MHRDIRSDVGAPDVVRSLVRFRRRQNNADGDQTRYKVGAIAPVRSVLRLLRRFR